LHRTFNYFDDRLCGKGDPFYDVLCTDSRTSQACYDALVIGRYSVLPWYEELDKDLAHQGSRLINSTAVHNYIAEMRWYPSLGPNLTPETWRFGLDSVPDDCFPVVLKGETNSKKHLWDTHMYAETKADAVQVMLRLFDDSLIHSQKVVVRRYVPLKTFMTGLRGLPITEEYRFFVAYGKVLAGGFYWSSHVDDLPEVPKASNVPKEFLDEVIDALSPVLKYSFYVVDVARKEDGGWMVVEVNDGQMSGLSEVDPDELYINLRTVVQENNS
jgi:hypothetical protein